ncbi:hypothetical protein CIB48_g9087 [Xylaria polymorpha]|nr:hypothetical protein CIB48_g9087 [Xylaria polymorpha]
MRNPGRWQPMVHRATSAKMPHRVCVFVRLALMASIPSSNSPHLRKAVSRDARRKPRRTKDASQVNIDLDTKAGPEPNRFQIGSKPRRKRDDGILAV